MALAPWMAGTHGSASPLREVGEKAGQLDWAWYSVSTGLSEQGDFFLSFLHLYLFLFSNLAIVFLNSLVIK